MSKNFEIQDFSGNDFIVTKEGNLEITKTLIFVPKKSWLNQVDLFLDPDFPRVGQYWHFWMPDNTTTASKNYAESRLKCKQVTNTRKIHRHG